MQAFNITFDDYLQEVCFEDNPEVYKDNRPDFFEKWLEDLEKDEIFKYADRRIKQLNLIIERTVAVGSLAVHELEKIRDMAKN